LDRHSRTVDKGWYSSLVDSRGADNTPTRENNLATNMTQDVEHGGVVWNETDLGKLTWSGTCLDRPGSFFSQICWEYRSIGAKVALNQQHQKI
jgi:hypothetical protein